MSELTSAQHALCAAESKYNKLMAARNKMRSEGKLHIWQRELGKLLRARDEAEKRLKLAHSNGR